MKKLTIPVDALESERINKGIRRLVREGFLKDNPDSQICRVRNAAAGATCRQCGAVIDAFDHLLSLAKGETKLDWELRVLRGEIKQHREGLEKLKREEVNCKGRIKTAQFRLADVNRALVEAGDKLVAQKTGDGKP
ncbi:MULTISPECIES: hypothetical protein [Serratia]|uniref:hypothetical protein n=1 Tax=Serratia TaxID=613 RepID=UPI002751D65C|nr:hypothetical protein [Serratia marcescens]MDP8624901.1 hypothetical protein [Serratia marcescens]MDP8674332.1 hypothetical protein [Serratia marcescens]MDP8689334.1 hypothetical protein [Serratia marcescens]MDP8699081.1 hypothetical protein [Serratia marcescens]MDP8708759.1 hypothetical protein [Serratia marcescens]